MPASMARLQRADPTFSAASLFEVWVPLNSASRVEAETERQAGALAVVDDLGIDVGVSTGHAKTRTLGSTRDLAREHDADDA